MTEKRTETTAARESMNFPLRWFETLRALDDGDLRLMLDAIGNYAAHGELPNLSGALAALWNELRQRIDRDIREYEAVCERNREYGRRGGRPKKNEKPSGFNTHEKKPTGFSEAPIEPEKPDADADADAEADADDISLQKVSDDTFSPERRENVAPGRRKNPEKIRFDYDGDARLHGVTPEQLAVWKENFPAIDVQEELCKATVWLDANRKQRKHDVKRFLASWLARAQDRAKAPPGPRTGLLTEARRTWSDTERG